MFVLETLVSVLTVNFFVEAVPVVFKESTPNGESIVAISSSDPNVEKYYTQQFATRSGFTQLHPEDQKNAFNNVPQNPQGAVHSSFSIAVPGKAVAGAGRSFASASSGPFLPLFAFPIAPDGFGFNNFDLNGWVRNIESFYNPNFAGNSQVNTATAINDNGHIYGNINSVPFDNRQINTEHNDNRPITVATIDNNVNKDESIDNRNKTVPDKKIKNLSTYDNKPKYRNY